MNIAYIYLVLLIIPLIIAIRLILTAKKLENTTNEKDISGFEIAKSILMKKDTYIVERRDAINNMYDDARDTLKFSTRVFHDSDILISTISAFYAMSVGKKNMWKGNFLRVLDIVNLLSLLFFIIGILTYSFDFIYVATAIIIISLSVGIINLNNSSKIASDAIDYLIEKRIITKEYAYLKDLIKYIFIARIITVVIDCLYKGIRKIKS